MLGLAVSATSATAAWQAQPVDITGFEQHRQAASDSWGLAVSQYGWVEAVGPATAADGSRTIVHYRHKTGGPWRQLSDGAAPTSTAVAASSEGGQGGGGRSSTGRLLFSGPTGSNSATTLVSGFTVGGSPAAPVAITAGVGVQSSQALAINDQRQALLAFSGFNGLQVQTRGLEPGAKGWSSPFRIDRQSIGWGPKVDLSNYGDAIVAGADGPARLARLEDGVWRKQKAPAGVGRSFGTTDWRPEVEVTPEGTALLAWTNPRTGVSWAAHSRRGGKRWTTRKISNRGERLRPVGLESDASGRALAIFARVNGRGLVRASYVEGRAFRRSGLVAGSALRHAGRQSVAMDVSPSGEAVVAWAEPTKSGNARIRSVRRGQIGGWGRPEIVAKAVPRRNRDPLGAVKVGESGDTGMVINGYGLAWAPKSGAKDNVKLVQRGGVLRASLVGGPARKRATAAVFEVRKASAAETTHPIATWRQVISRSGGKVVLPGRVRAKLGSGGYVVSTFTYGRQVKKRTRSKLAVR